MANEGHDSEAPLTGCGEQGSLEDLSFQQSLEEIESIVDRIEAEDVDIDQLAEQLQRATKLLEVCRAKIRKAEVEVRHIVDKLDDGGTEGG